MLTLQQKMRDLNNFIKQGNNIQHQQREAHDNIQHQQREAQDNIQNHQTQVQDNIQHQQTRSIRQHTTSTNRSAI